MRTSKNIALLMIVALTSFYAQAQNQIAISNKENGVYRTFKDFISHHFTDSLHSNNMKGYMKDNGMDKVILKEGKQKRVYSEGEIYGYTLNGKNYRYFDTNKPFEAYGYFEILENNGLVIYRQYEEKNDQPFYSYYYSKGLNSPIKTLAKHNLKYELKDKDYVISVFQTQNICEFKNGEYTVNRIYNHFKNQSIGYENAKIDIF